MTVASLPPASVASAASASLAPLHGAASASSVPIPHSLALVAAVLGLWVAIGVGVAAADRLLARLGATE